MNTIEDVTKKQILIKGKHLKSINSVLNWNLDGSDLKATVELCNEKFEVLKHLDRNTRSVFSSIVERSEYKHRRIVLLSLIQQSLALSDYDMGNYLDILIRYKLICDPYIDDDYRGYISEIEEPEGWDMWGEIKSYCELENITLEEIIVELDFEKLD
ncbi:hypothetical protein V7212_11755 [Bacillus safensis]|uniref:hypothetical protein n=1 Tax=Bacillus safensis TaxID=561879 RepID=UPI002FFFE1ED